MRIKFRKCISAIMITCIAVVMSVFLNPANYVYAAGNTINNIPVVGYDAQGNEYQLQPKATFTLDSATFTSMTADAEFHIILEDVTYDWEKNRNPLMDNDYELGLSYNPYIFCVKPGTLTPDEVYTGTVTVPIPDGYDGATAKVFEEYDMINEPDTTKRAVASYTDTTITMPAKMKYWETNESDGNGGFVTIGGFSSHLRVEFKKKIAIDSLKTNASLTPATSEYNGSAITPKVTITGLTENTDFTVAYSNNTNAGTAKATVTGKNLYKGTFDLPFTITTASIESKKAAASLSATEFDHTGSAITPDITITGLTKDTDFTIAYANNVDIGTATATVTGKGNYTGSFTLDYIIKKAEDKSKEDDKTEAKVEDNKGQDYNVTSNGATKTATYEAPKSKKETKITIPNSITLKDGTKVPVTKVAANACKKNTKLKSATIGNNVKDVGNNAFNGCSSLTTLKFGKKVENIGAGAARNCKKLKKTTIPASTKKIGANAFNGDSNLTNLIINCKSLKSIGNGAIKSINPKATITLKGTAKQKKAVKKLITNKKTGYKSTMKINM